ncbi:MAG: UDP-N-acetylglucosamine 2-epimerase (non-hydrolyzing) [Cryomorphaceae bacterium]|nr:MAG: UDP-N-acetylglucosamine 2-epimerase (non-hydrolyzing) [Cryomorphaceae bacterium]
MSRTILQIIGARPQFVKLAVVSRALAAHSGVREIIVHTGQHFDANMSAVFFEELEIPQPDFNLGIHGTGNEGTIQTMREALVALMQSVSSDVVVVYGDTYSTLAGALAAEELQIPLAHVEAGLRSFNASMPEEHNRIETDKRAHWLFAPTDVAMMNLANEGLDKAPRIVANTGDVMYDAVRYYAQRAKNESIEPVPGHFVLCTLHRAENTDDPERLKELVDALNEISRRFEIVLPLHPRTRQRLQSFGLRFVFPTHPPLSYLRILQLLRHCQFVLTDSGGLQKEAYFLGKYCITLRDETEWTELVKGGYNQLAGADKQRILAAVQNIPSEKGVFSEGWYGQGNAGEKIVSALLG